MGIDIHISYDILLDMGNNLRHLDQRLIDHFDKYKEVMVLLGARQVGKTTILKKIFPKAYYLSVDNDSIRRNLERYDISVYRQMLPQDRQITIIDEIHLIKNPGRAAKIIYDQIPDVKLIITGSSSLKIKHRSGESLAGRKIDYYLYPLTFSEYLTQKGIEGKLNFNIADTIISDTINSYEERAYAFDMPGIMENILLYGLYPALLNHPNDRTYLENLIDSVIFKDLLDLNLIENRQAALNLLRLLAFQIGSLVNISELAGKLSLDAKTVRRYISIFEQSFIIFSLYPFAKSHRDEIGKMPKIYFYDVGLRNALIGNFHSLVSRTDTGVLFENFIIAEVVKQNYYGNFGLTMHFWRTKQGSEIDLVLGKEGKLYGIEIKTGQNRQNSAFGRRYPQAKVRIVNLKNFY